MAWSSNAQRYERSAARRDTRAGHYERDLQAKCFLVDTLGLLLHAIVHPADIQDRDGGYQGPEFQKALSEILPQLKTDIIKRSDQAKGFVVLPRRWIVEQSNEPSLGSTAAEGCQGLGEPQSQGASIAGASKLLA